jgi:tRNA dimethylallyltransferase
VIVLAGPTGIGKSEVAMALAREIPAEIVAVDSMQVYRGMEIGTGKPAEEVRRAIPHHGIDLADPEEEFDVLRYMEAVSPVLEGIRRRGRWAILTAGCGLYLRVLRRGICEAPGKDPEVRARFLERASAGGTAPLHARLAEVDPEAARRIHPNDLRRVVRALEVFEVTGRPITRWHREQEAFSRDDWRMIGLECERQRLYGKIEQRIDGWLAGGWVEEARALAQRNLGLTAREALGYRELFSHFEGHADWALTRDLIHRNTRRYAKRQLSWFRHEPGVEWVAAHPDPAAVAREILAKAQAA